jgi:hypothetical protein
MNYPDPIGINLLYQPDFDAVTRILSRSRGRIIGESGFEKPARLKKGGAIGAYIRAMDENGGWITPLDLSIHLDQSLSQVQNALARMVRQKKLQKRYRPDGTREYGPL